MPLLTRRSMFLGLGAALAAPAIVRAGSLMPVRSLLRLPNCTVQTFAGGITWIDQDFDFTCGALIREIVPPHWLKEAA